MKRVFYLTLILVTGFLSGQELKLMTYNIKYDNVNDTVNNWNDRKSGMVEFLKSHNPDFIGMQEVLFNQLDYLNTALPSYKTIGVGREDGKKKGEFSPIFYDTENFDLLESNTFWLSKTPSEISVGWDAALERVCTYGLFQNKTSNEKIWVFNTHFDHRGTKARIESAQLILKKIKMLNTEKLPVILMGDLNLMPEEKAIQGIKKVMSDGFETSKTAATGPKGTFNGFDIVAPIERRIDYIFTTGFKVESYQHIDQRLPNGKHISDHLPVLATLSTNE